MNFILLRSTCLFVPTNETQPIWSVSPSRLKINNVFLTSCLRPATEAVDPVDVAEPFPPLILMYYCFYRSSSRRFIMTFRLTTITAGDYLNDIGFRRNNGGFILSMWWMNSWLD